MNKRIKSKVTRKFEEVLNQKLLHIQYMGSNLGLVFENGSALFFEVVQEFEGEPGLYLPEPNSIPPYSLVNMGIIEEEDIEAIDKQRTKCKKYYELLRKKKTLEAIEQNGDPTTWENIKEVENFKYDCIHG